MKSQRKVNLFTLGTVIYTVAVLVYAFKNKNSDWALYHYNVRTFLIAILIYFAFKKKKTELDKSLALGIGFIQLFNAITYSVWHYTGSSWQNQPNVFCILVAVSFMIGIFINKNNIIWKR